MAAESIGSFWLWAGFLAFVLAMLAVDLGLFHRKDTAISFKDAGAWSLVWVALSLAFGGIVWWQFGQVQATEFITGYVIEKSLSVDNLFVFVVIFTALRIPAEHQHRVLFWGILTALVLRAVMIFAGIALLERFHWLIYVLGAFLIFTSVKIIRMWKQGEDEHPEDGRLYKFIQRVVPSTSTLHGHHFFTVENGRRLATPLFVALLLVEFTDVVFALDSIPAIFAITTDPFLVFTSNIFAIMGLRSLYFLLAGAVAKFQDLKLGLAGVLAFVGAKMTLSDFVHISPAISLAVIVGLLGASLLYTLWRKRGPGAARKSVDGPPPTPPVDQPASTST